MQRVIGAGRIAAAVFAVAVVGCASFGRPGASATTCFPNKCLLNVENDNGRPISVRYYDSTGIGDVLGRVRGMGGRPFGLTRRTARAITVEVTRDKEVFRAQTTVSPEGYQNVIRFPADFQPVAVVK